MTLIRELRAPTGLTQAEIPGLAGVGCATLSLAESGHIRLQSAQALKRVLLQALRKEIASAQLVGHSKDADGTE